MLTLGFMLLPPGVDHEPGSDPLSTRRLPRRQRGTRRLEVADDPKRRPPRGDSGVTTGVILGVGRIAGETAPILLTMGGGVLPANRLPPTCWVASS